MAEVNLTLGDPIGVKVTLAEGATNVSVASAPQNVCRYRLLLLRTDCRVLTASAFLLVEMRVKSLRPMTLIIKRNGRLLTSCTSTS